MKKLSTLLGSLLLSVSPAIADDLVYLECESNLLTTIKDLKSNQITKREEPTETTYHKIDLANSRTASAKKPGWEEVKIVDGVILLDQEFTVNGVDMKMNGFWQIVPPGRFTGDGLASNDAFSATFKVRGICKAIDESVFEKALNQ